MAMMIPTVPTKTTKMVPVAAPQQALAVHYANDAQATVGTTTAIVAEGYSAMQDAGKLCQSQILETTAMAAHYRTQVTTINYADHMKEKLNEAAVARRAARAQKRETNRAHAVSKAKNLEDLQEGIIDKKTYEENRVAIGEEARQAKDEYHDAMDEAGDAFDDETSELRTTMLDLQETVSNQLTTGMTDLHVTYTKGLEGVLAARRASIAMQAEAMSVACEMRCKAADTWRHEETTRQTVESQELVVDLKRDDAAHTKRSRQREERAAERERVRETSRLDQMNIHEMDHAAQVAAVQRDQTADAAASKKADNSRAEQRKRREQEREMRKVEKQEEKDEKEADTEILRLELEEAWEDYNRQMSAARQQASNYKSHQITEKKPEVVNGKVVRGKVTLNARG